MAIYYGSAFGYIRGKLGDAVGQIGPGGIRIVRAYTKTEHKISKKISLTKIKKRLAETTLTTLMVLSLPLLTSLKNI